MGTEEATPHHGSPGPALLCPYEYEDPAFRRAGRLPNLRYGDQVRAIWVTRYDFQNDADIIQIMQRSAQSGFNTVFFQVRGNATTYYPSKLEPWSEDYDWQSPGFDPLQLAIQEAHTRNMALHAWINVMPMWRGSAPPTNKDQMYWRHQEWSWYDRNGVRQPLNRGFYVSMNPCLPEARDHVVGVCREIVSRYEIDGLHLDYIRFPNEPPVVAGREYPRDKKTMELFQVDTGFAAEEMPDLWDQWRCDCVTALLRDIRRTAKSIRPQLVLTAAVGAELKQALSKFQDVERWWKERLVDAVVPMNYTNCHKKFRSRVEQEWLDNSRKHHILPLTRLLRRLQPVDMNHKRQGPKQLVKGDSLVEWSPLPDPAIVMGISVEFGGSKLHQKQLALALQRFGHFSVFCYSSLFKQEEKRQPLLSFIRIIADASNILLPSVGHQSSHPFSARDTFAHPEEAFPYDQLHMYDHVPAASAYRPPLKQERPESYSWRHRRKGKHFLKIGDPVKYHRRTARRKLLLKYRSEEIFFGKSGKKMQQHGSSFIDTEENIFVYSGMDNWEREMMSKATREQGQKAWSFKDGLMKFVTKVVGDPSSAGHVAGEVILYEGDSPVLQTEAQTGVQRWKPTTVNSPLCSISSLISPQLHNTSQGRVSKNMIEALQRMGLVLWRD